MFESYLELANSHLVDSSRVSELKERNETQAHRIEKLVEQNGQLHKKLNNQRKYIIKKVNGSYNKTPVRNTLRKAVYERDGYKCLKCGSKKRLTIDHIVPRIKGGINHIDNLQTLCSRCNSIKMDKYIDYRER